MELEVGLKISKAVDDFISSTDLLIAKDRSGPLFVSRETVSMFILTAHLKGYKRELLKIEINKDGTRIDISGEKLVQEMVMVGWRMHEKEVEMRGFRKVFKIPDAVILDKIKAMFNEEESVLTISMPKAMKGIRGIGVEEVKEEEVVEILPILPDEKKEGQKSESSTLESHDQGIGTVESTRVVHGQVRQEKGNEIPPPLVVKDQEQKDDETTQGNQPPEKRSMIRAPVIAGSAFLVSVIVVVIHLIRKKNPPRKKEN